MIKNGKYTPIEEIVGKGHYSDELIALIPLLLNVDKDKRCKMRDFMKEPIIWSQIGKTLQNNVYKENFAN